MNFEDQEGKVEDKVFPPPDNEKDEEGVNKGPSTPSAEGVKVQDNSPSPSDVGKEGKENDKPSPSPSPEAEDWKEEDNGPSLSDAEKGGKVQDKGPTPPDAEKGEKVQDNDLPPPYGEKGGKVQDKSPPPPDAEKGGKVQDNAPPPPYGEKGKKVQDKGPSSTDAEKGGKVQDKGLPPPDAEKGGKVQDKDLPPSVAEKGGTVQDKGPPPSDKSQSPRDFENVDPKDYQLESFGARHSLAILGFLGLCCDYALRVNLSVAIVAMVNNTGTTSSEEDSKSCPYPDGVNSTTSDVANTGDFNWEENTQGLILGSFFWGYFIANLPSGIAAEKYGGKLVLGVGIIATGVLSIISPWAASVSSGLFIFVRFLEGCTEAVFYPAMNSLIAKWYPKKERSKFTSFIFSGMQLGTVVALMSSGYLSASNFLGGWPSVFYVFGVLTLIWGVFWFWLVHNNPGDHPRISKEELRYITDGCPVIKEEKVSIPWKSIFTSVPFWAVAVGHVGQNWGFYTLLTELPTYFDRILHINMKHNGVFTAMPYLGGWIFTILFGFVTDRLIANGRLSILQLRRIAMVFALYGPMVSLIALCFVNCNKVWAIAILIISGTVNGSMFCGYMCSHVDISPRFAGTLMGITNSFATIPGFISPLVTGHLTNNNQTLGAWKIVFAISVIVYFVTNTFYLVFVQTTIQPWNEPMPQNSAKKSKNKLDLEKQIKLK